MMLLEAMRRKEMHTIHHAVADWFEIVKCARNPRWDGAPGGMEPRGNDSPFVFSLRVQESRTPINKSISRQNKINQREEMV